MRITKDNPLKIYLGCDLFVEGQRWQAKYVQTALEKALGELVDIYNPAENLSINDKKAGFASGKEILVADYQRLVNSNILIALMDTQDVGLAAEMGIAFERSIPIFQLYTDIRLQGNNNQDKLNAIKNDIFQNDFMYINKLVTGLSYLMINPESPEHKRELGHLKKPFIFTKTDDLIDAILDHVDLVFRSLKSIDRDDRVTLDSVKIGDHNVQIDKDEIKGEFLENDDPFNLLKYVSELQDKLSITVTNFITPGKDNCFVVLKRGNGSKNNIQAIAEIAMENDEAKITPYDNILDFSLEEAKEIHKFMINYSKLLETVGNMVSDGFSPS
ncbi:TPA: nucleoside 2-deoxyribosyltransferase [Streptococcus suis]